MWFKPPNCPNFLCVFSISILKLFTLNLLISNFKHSLFVPCDFLKLKKWLWWVKQCKKSDNWHVKATAMDTWQLYSIEWIMKYLFQVFLIAIRLISQNFCSGFSPNGYKNFVRLIEFSHNIKSPDWNCSYLEIKSVAKKIKIRHYQAWLV